jgi:hypothetical protein
MHAVHIDGTTMVNVVHLSDLKLPEGDARLFPGGVMRKLLVLASLVTGVMVIVLVTRFQQGPLFPTSPEADLP